MVSAPHHRSPQTDVCVCCECAPRYHSPDPNCTPSTQLRPPALHPLLTPPGGSGGTKIQVSLVTPGSQCQLGLSVTGLSDCQRHDHTNTEPPLLSTRLMSGKGHYTTLRYATLHYTTLHKHTLGQLKGGCTNTMQFSQGAWPGISLV